LFLRGKLFGVTDFFAELGLPPGAWVDVEEVKSSHRARIAVAHPDKPGGDVPLASMLNEARRVLESPSGRLRHLLELHEPGFAPGQKPAPDWELFSSTGEAVREAGNVAEQLAGVGSPIVRAGMLARAKACEERLAEVGALLSQRRIQLETKTRAVRVEPFDAAGVFILAEDWTFLERLETNVRQAEIALKTA
jgi:curved DNA-binding protein CbpA